MNIKLIATVIVIITIASTACYFIVSSQIEYQNTHHQETQSSIITRKFSTIENRAEYGYGFVNGEWGYGWVYHNVNVYYICLENGMKYEVSIADYVSVREGDLWYYQV